VNPGKHCADRSTLTAINAYEPRVTKAVNQLLAVVSNSNGSPVNMTKYLSLMVFEVIEDLAFNKSKNMVADGRADYIHEAIRRDMYGIGYLSHVPWIMPFLKRIPYVNGAYLKFMDCITEHIHERSNVSNPPPHRSLLTETS
jgi:cytochrome P450 family 628